MRGVPITDEQRAVILALSGQGLEHAEIARQLGLSRQRVSRALNAELDETENAATRLDTLGRLAPVLLAHGVEGASRAAADVGLRLDEPLDVTPEVIEQAAAHIVERSCPPEAALVDIGVDRLDARAWLADAEAAYLDGRRAWPATGWRLLDRACNRVGMQLLSAAVGDPSSAPARLRLGRLIAPGLFHEPETAGEGGPNPFDGYTDEEVAALAMGRP